MSLNKETLKEFKEKLLTEKTKLEEELSRFAKATDAPGEFETKIGNIGTDEDENASEVEEYADNLALENSLEKQLKDALDALKKIDDRTYGKCLNCQEYIDIERLKAYPAAKNCIKCSK